MRAPDSRGESRADTPPNFMENLQFVAGSAASISPLVIIDYPLDRQYRQLREQLGRCIDYLESNIMPGSECLTCKNADFISGKYAIVSELTTREKQLEKFHTVYSFKNVIINNAEMQDDFGIF